MTHQTQAERTNHTHTVWMGAGHQHAHRRQQRAIRHRQIRRLLPPRPTRERLTDALVYALVFGTLGGVVVFAAVTYWPAFAGLLERLRP